LRRLYSALLGSLVTLDQDGRAAAFLISDRARFITGQVVYVDAGYDVLG
jgi:enoyl-[acyl-carrier protein] reductase I